MKNLKKLLAVALAVAMMITAFVPAFAADAAAPALSADATICKDIGMLLGAGAGVTPEYTATKPSRIQSAVLFLRLKGLEADAKAFTGTDNFSDVTAGWEKPYTAYLKAHPELGFAGIGDGKFDPDSKITAAQYYKVVLTGLGYEQGKDFEFKDVITFAAGKGLKAVADVKEFTVDSLATATVEGLKATVKGGTDTLVATLVKAGKVDAAKAEAAKIYTKAPAAQALDISNVAALNSKIVEVTLNTAVTAVSKADATVKDTAGKAIAVVDAKLAPYDSKGKTVLFTLESDTASGTYYTLTSGTASKTFGGRAVDTTKPTISGSNITSSDYNEATIEFSEPVQLDGATVTIAEKYGNKAALAVSGVKYGDSSSKIVVTTAAQKAATLYAVTVSGVKDWAGNVMDLDSAQTFAGQAMSTDVQKVIAAGATDPDKVIVQFDVNVDPATVTADNFKVAEFYGANASVAVKAARMANTTDDTDVTGAANSLTTANVKKYVVLTVDTTMKDSTVYKVTATNVKTLYGTALSTTVADTYKTFTGKAKPTELKFDTVAAVSTSNTSVNVKFNNKLDKASAETIANYAVTLSYGTNAALAVKKAELQSDNKTVKLTTDVQANSLYKLVVTGVKDVYGNSNKTTDSANQVTFAGMVVKEKIKNITGITRPAGTDGDTQIIVTFDQNVGATATDVSHYSIDNSVGYPTKAEVNWASTAAATQVRLTIPKTTQSKVYTLTVKNLENSDGVAMDAAGITGTFVGQGNNATLPEIQAAIAVDNQTLKIYFDRDVKDSLIDGAAQLWTDANNQLVAGKLTYQGSAPAVDISALVTEYVWQDADNKSILNVRIPTAGAFKAANANTSNKFTLTGAAALFNTSKNTVDFAPIEDNPAAITVDSVMPLDSKTIRVYFNQPVYAGVNGINNFAQVQFGASNSNLWGNGTIYTLANGSAADKTNRVYDFAVTGNNAANALVSGTTYYLVVNPNSTVAAGAQYIKDTNWATPGFVTVKDEDTATANIQQSRQFAGTSAAPANISDISVVAVDKRTLDVYFPRVMNATGVANTTANGAQAASVLNFSNYTLVDGNGTAVAGAPAINYISYDLATNKATIYYNGNIPSATAGNYLQIAATVADAANVSTIATAGFKKQFALTGAADAPKVTISSAVYDGVAGTLKITFNQKVYGASVAAPAANLAALLADLKISFTNSAGTLTAVANNAAGTVTSTTTFAALRGAGLDTFDKDNGNTLTITLAAGAVDIKADAIGKVEFTATPPTLLGVDGVGYDPDFKGVTFAQKQTH